VNKTIARIKQKLERDDKRVLNHVIYTMRSSDRSVQQAVSWQSTHAAGAVRQPVAAVHVLWMFCTYAAVLHMHGGFLAIVVHLCEHLPTDQF
jgi:hypothetical protein